MAELKKAPYYQPQKGLFGVELKEFKGVKGCIPLDTPTGVSIDRLPPGVKPPSPTNHTTGSKKANKKTQILPPAPPSKTPQAMAKRKAIPTEIEFEVCENPPAFDLQDVPLAMDQLGWTVSATLARTWFSSAAHTFDDDPRSEQPINDSVVTLDWALRFGSVRKKYEKFLASDIYTPRAIGAATDAVKSLVRQLFESRNSNLNVDTSRFLGDLRNFHADWQFQKLMISDADTFNGLTLTDLTGSLANFNIYAAVGNVEISTEKYFKYERGRTLYCLNATGKITHVYVYVKDNYSFNGKQYLGHWNKHGIIIAPGTWLTGSSWTKRDTDIDIWLKAINKPVDTRKGLFGKFKEPDVYFPVFNADYNRWREKHQMGGDFMVYSKPVHLKLKKPIDLKLGEICRPESLSSLG